MIALYIVVGIPVVAALGWIVMVSFRRPARIGELIDQVETSLATRLQPFVELKEPSLAWDDEQLWTALGGLRGLLLVYRECGALVTISIQIGKAYPEEAKQTAEQMLWTAIYLRMTVLACLIEMLAKRAIPPLPRIQARSAARLYCDIAASLDVLRSICEPGPSAGFSAT